MKKTVIAFALSFTVALMMIAQPVSAGTKTVIAYDSTGDLGFGVDYKDSSIKQQWSDNAPIVQAGYLDMKSTWLSLKGKTYTFGMELSAVLPQKGTALPMGLHSAEWVMWIDPEPWHYTLNPVPSLFYMGVRYDGSSYSAFMLDYATMVRKSVPFSVDGSMVQLEFSAASIGNLESFWWMPSVRAYWGPLGSAAYWFVDCVDRESIPGQVWEELPWGSPSWDYPLSA